MCKFELIYFIVLLFYTWLVNAYSTSTASATALVTFTFQSSENHLSTHGSANVRLSSLKIPEINNKQQKTKIQFVTKFSFSNLSRVNPLHRQIKKGSLKNRNKPTADRLITQEKSLEVTLQADAKLAVTVCQDIKPIINWSSLIQMWESNNGRAASAEIRLIIHYTYVQIPGRWVCSVSSIISFEPCDCGTWTNECWRLMNL